MGCIVSHDGLAAAAIPCPPTTSDGLLMHISNRCHPVDAGQVRQGHHHEGPSPSYWAASAHAEVWGSPGGQYDVPSHLTISREGVS